MGQSDFLNQRRKRHTKNWLSSKKITKWGLGPWEPTINIHYIWFDTVFFQKRLHHYRMDFDLPVSRKSKIIVKVRVWSLQNGFLIFLMVLFADTCFSTDDSMWKSWDKKYSKLILGQIFWEAHSASPERLLPSLPPPFTHSSTVYQPNRFRISLCLPTSNCCMSGFFLSINSLNIFFMTIGNSNRKKNHLFFRSVEAGIWGCVEYAFT